MTEHSYDWWHRGLAGALTSIDFKTDVIHPGFYRLRRKRRDGTKGPWLPVAIFPDEPPTGELVCLVDGQESNPYDIWNFCCQHPVTEKAYNLARTSGEWDDIAPGSSEATEDAVELGRMVAQAQQSIEVYQTIEDDEHAEKAQSLRSRFLKFATDADKLRMAEKRPLLDEGARIDGIWQPIVSTAKESANRIRDALDAYQTRKAKAAKADRTNEPLPTHVRPTDGSRAARIETVKVIKEVTDRDALFHWLVEHYPEVKKYMLGIATGALNHGMDVPGVRFEEERRVK